MNFRSSGGVLSPQWYKSATTCLRPGNESYKTKAIASFLCSPSVYFSSPVVSCYSRNSMSDQYTFQSSFKQAAFLAWNICSRKFLLTESYLALLHLLAAHSCFQGRIWKILVEVCFNSTRLTYQIIFTVVSCETSKTHM